MPSISHDQLVEVIALEADIPKMYARKSLYALGTVIPEILKTHKELKLHRLGTFTLTDKVHSKHTPLSKKFKKYEVNFRPTSHLADSVNNNYTNITDL